MTTTEPEALPRAVLEYDLVKKCSWSPDPNGHLLHIQDLVKCFKGKDCIKTVLDNVDLQVSKGELISVVGPSGCGKSTLLKLILGAEEPTRGMVLLNGQQVGYPDTTRGIVDQQYALFPHLTVLQNVLLPYQLKLGFAVWQTRKKELVAQAEHFLETAQLSEHKDKYPYQLSGGQQQRAAVMQGLINDPKILLMDEPFGALDPGARQRMQTFLLSKWEETGKTIFFVTHDLEEAVFLGTRVIVLSQYYTDGRGDVQRGSRIVCDLKVGEVGKPNSTRSKEDPEFGKTIERVRKYLLQPTHAWHLDQFDLSHPDSFHTVSAEEVLPR